MKSSRSILLAYTLFLSVLFLSACGGGGTEDTTDKNGGSTTGVITLSGDDAATVGTLLDTGYVGSSLAAEGQPDYIVIVDKSSTVSFEAPNILTPNIADPENGFVLVVTDDGAGSGVKGVSMSIVVGGIKYDYICHTPNTANWSVECGGANSIFLDIAGRTITFDSTAVINTDTGTILTIDGTLTWGGSNPTPPPLPTSTGSNISVVSGSQLGSATTSNSLLRKSIGFSLDTPNNDFSLGAAYATKPTSTSTAVYWMAEITNTSNLTHCFIKMENGRFLASDDSELGTDSITFVSGEMRIIGSDIYTNTCLAPGGSGHLIGIEPNISMNQLNSIAFETLTVSSSANQMPALSMSASSYTTAAPRSFQDIELMVVNAGPAAGILDSSSLSLLLDNNDDPLLWTIFSLPAGESGELASNESTLLEDSIFYEGSSSKLMVYLDYEALTANRSSRSRGIGLRSVLSRSSFSTIEEYLHYFLGMRNQNEQLKQLSQ